MGVSGKQQPGVVIYRPQDSSGESHRRLEASGCRLIIADPGDDLDAFLRRANPVHALLAATMTGPGLTGRELRALPDLRIVSKYTIGFDDVDLATATDLGVIVTHAPTEANYGGVAEGTIALMLAVLKKLEIRNARVRAGGWRSDDMRGVYLGAREDGYPGITLGIVGLGRIGRRIARLMAPWRFRICAFDPYVEDSDFQRYGVERAGLDELLSLSDVVSVHCSLTDETKGLINADKLSLMPSHAVLINTARGAIVDPDAVCDALDAGRLGGAAFDVFPEEPPPAAARILSTDERVILSPHMVAANQDGTLKAAIPWATDAVLAALRGDVPEHVCNPAAIDLWKQRFGDKPLLGTETDIEN